jgi:hypothetical protein
VLFGFVLGADMEMTRKREVSGKFSFSSFLSRTRPGKQRKAPVSYLLRR